MLVTYQGIWAPTPTPLTKSGNVDEKRIRLLVDFLIDGGVDGLFPLGTSGEFALLSRSERKSVVLTVADQAKGRVPVFAGVSDPSLENVKLLVADAEAAGADGIIATPPYYYTTSPGGVREHFEAISEFTDLPLMIYNIPEWTHTPVPPDVVRVLAEKRVVVGMKYTEYNFLNLIRYIKASSGRISVFTGSDAMVSVNLEFGGRGGIISTADVAPRLAARIFDLHRSGDLSGARKAQLELLPVIEATGIGIFPAGLKEAMKFVGMPVGEVRPPLQPLNAQERRMVKAHMKKAGLVG